MKFEAYLKPIHRSFRHYPAQVVFEIEIPDEVIKEYAKEYLDLLDQEEAYRFVEENPPEKH